MPKTIAAAGTVIVGVVIAFSQIFREEPNTAIFSGGLLLALFGLIAFGDFVVTLTSKDDNQ